VPDVRGSVFLMSMAIITIYSLTAGTFTTLIISEEKDKKNLRTLILTGVKTPEYIFSTILFPFLFSIIGVWVMPITFGISIPNLALYSLVTFLTILCFILVNFAIALFSKNQTQASAVSLIFYLVIMTLPMFSSINKFAKLLTDIEETTDTRTQVPTTAEINANKDNLRNSVGNLQNKINSARQENNKEIEVEN